MKGVCQRLYAHFGVRVSSHLASPVSYGLRGRDQGREGERSGRRILSLPGTFTRGGRVDTTTLTHVQTRLRKPHSTRPLGLVPESPSLGYPTPRQGPLRGPEERPVPTQGRTGTVRASPPHRVRQWEKCWSRRPPLPLPTHSCLSHSVHRPSTRSSDIHV